MGRIDAVLPDKLEHIFRMEAGKRLGARRGVFTLALTQAIEDWLKQDPEARKALEEWLKSERKRQ